MKISLLFFMMALCLFGCAPTHPDIQAKVTRQEISIPKTYFYLNATWISQNLLAIVYNPGLRTPLPPNELIIFNLSTHDIVNVPMPPRSSSCQSDWEPVATATSPSRDLVFDTKCDLLRSPQLLMKYNPKTGELEQLFDYGDMSMTHLSFISSHKVVQENAVGAPMSNELWMISLVSQTQTQVLTNFLRASNPSWSLQKKLIAFWATETFPGNKPRNLYTQEDINCLVKYPWDLYVMDENAEHVRKALPLVANIGGLEWSPTSDLLAFGGTVDNVEGIWLLDINNPIPVRIFDHAWLFTWSPDGQKMIVIGTKFPEEKNNSLQVSAYILSLPECVFASTCK